MVFSKPPKASELRAWAKTRGFVLRGNTGDGFTAPETWIDSSERWRLKMKLEDLSFDNCVIVDFSRDAMHNNLTLTFEAYETNSAESNPALYVLECSGVKNVNLRFSSEFRTDLDRHYDTGAEDLRANEIYELWRDASGHIYLVADMISGRFYCQKYRLARVVEVGASVVV